MFAKIVSKAYQYTKSHSDLWLFGIPFVSIGLLYVFLKVAADSGMWFGSMIDSAANQYQTNGAMTMLIALVITLSVFVGSWFRGALIWAVFKMENSEPVTLSQAIKKGLKYVWFVAAVGGLGFFVMMLGVGWVSAPILLVFNRALIFRAVLLGIMGLVVFVPVACALMLASMFAVRFRIIFDMSWKHSLRSALDLVSRNWVEGTQLFVGIGVMYVIVLVLAISLASAIGVGGYGTLQIVEPFIFSGFFDIIVLFGIGLAAFVLFSNAILNCFANISWTLFFLEKVNSSKVPKPEFKVMPGVKLAEDGAVSSAIKTIIKGG